jgi:hypothetical protein
LGEDRQRKFLFFNVINDPSPIEPKHRAVIGSKRAVIAVTEGALREIVMLDFERIAPEFAEAENPFVVVPKIEEGPEINMIGIEIAAAFVVPARGGIE